MENLKLLNFNIMHDMNYILNDSLDIYLYAVISDKVSYNIRSNIDNKMLYSNFHNFLQNLRNELIKKIQ